MDAVAAAKAAAHGDFAVLIGFRFYEPLLMRIYGVSAILALAGLLSTLGGLWRRNPLRWLTLGCALGMLVFWIVSMTGE